MRANTYREFQMGNDSFKNGQISGVHIICDSISLFAKQEEVTKQEIIDLCARLKESNPREGK